MMPRELRPYVLFLALFCGLLWALFVALGGEPFIVALPLAVGSRIGVGGLMTVGVNLSGGVQFDIPFAAVALAKMGGMFAALLFLLVYVPRWTEQVEAWLCDEEAA